MESWRRESTPSFAGATGGADDVGGQECAGSGGMTTVSVGNGGGTGAVHPARKHTDNTRPNTLLMATL